ncbi:hypothetical protein [Microbacterium caowuchunii]|uniref:hypothetical protein n=1 Tax=Microbacterium caowuchunii TaxID=2614638 RepID=UPI001EE99001|nr:hypothetical protein [Microbacterium caowuchunii]
MHAPDPRRPLVVTMAAVLVALSGGLNTVLGLLLLLSRYDVPADEVLTVSLVGVGILLFGLLTLAIASGIARASGLSRLLLTLYLAVQLALHTVTIFVSDVWDWTSIVQILLGVGVLVVVWSPPGSRYFGTHLPPRDPYEG